MSAGPSTSSARRRPSRNALETANETTLGAFNDRIPPAGNMAVDGNGYLSQGKDSGGKKIGHGMDSPPNGRIINRVSSPAMRRGTRGRSPVRGEKPGKILSLFKAVRIFVKWVILFTIIGGLARGGWVAWNWMKNTPKYVANPSDLVNEGRVAELEDFLKKTTKMLQVQMELVDIKYGKEAEALKRHLEERIEEKATAFYTQLQNLKAQTGDIEESLLKLKETEVLTRQEVLGLVNYVVDARAREGSGQPLSFDDVRAVARRLVEVEIEKHAADGLGRVDYALGSGGGRVVQHSEGYFPGNGRTWGLASLDFLRKGGMHPYSTKVLEPSFGEPGQCLPLKGTKAFIVIALRTSIFVEAVTLEHVAKNVAYDRSSAPKDFRIFGWLDLQNEGVTDEGQQMFLLGEFTYDLEKSSAQTFNIPMESTGKLVNMIKLDVQSNHGSPSHTCIYRLRVHGKEPEVLKPVEIEA